MKTWAIGLAVLGMMAAGLTIGCDADRAPEDTSEYNPEVDAPPTNLDVQPNSDLVDNQVKVAGRQPAPGSTDGAGSSDGSGSSGGAVPDGPPEEQVKTIMAKIITAAKGGDGSVLLAHMNADDRAAMQAVMDGMDAMATATVAYTKAVEDKGLANAPDMSEGMPGGGGNPMLDAITEHPVGDLEFIAEGDTVTVKSPTDKAGEPPNQFVKNGDRWELQIPAEAKPMIGIMGELLGAMTQACTKLTEGVNSGSITDENIAAEHQAVMESTVAPIMMKMMALGFLGAGGGGGLETP